MQNAIELDQVTKRFGAQIAVDQLELRVPLGSIYGFIGPNGSGKTTTLRMILRIIQPDAGRVRVLGQDQGATADNRLGYLPEERGLYKRMKVYDLLAFFARLKGVKNPRPAIDRWLDRLNARDWSRKRIDMLSKGMAQKIQFIAAVVAQPSLIVLDEPFSGLDPVNLELLREAILELRAQGTTVVLSTHDMDLAERMCDTIFMIFRGRKVLDGSMDSIHTRYPANHVRVRLENPEADLPPLSGVQSIERVGRFYEFILDDERMSQNLLRQLASQVSLTHFELVKPSLHDIFIHIARPEQNGQPPSAGGV
jgi:ABC-2 type transport system ATP-binding protein